MFGRRSFVVNHTKPNAFILNPANKFAHGVLAAFTMSDVGSRTPPAKYGGNIVYDRGPLGMKAYWAGENLADFKYVLSPYGPAAWFDTGFRGSFDNEWGKHWDGLNACSTVAVARRREAATHDTILTAGLFGTSTTKLEFAFETSNKLWYGVRPGTQAIVGSRTDTTFASTSKWYFVAGTSKIRNGENNTKIYVDGILQPSTDQGSCSFDTFDAQFGSWDCNVGGIDYGALTWSKQDLAFCYHFGWELTQEDVQALMADPYQMFRHDRFAPYARTLIGGPVPHYMITLPKKQGQTIVSGDRTLVVEAATAELARDYAEARKVGDTASWADATVTLVEDATEKYAGSTWRIKISGKPVPSPDAVDVSYTAQAGDSLDNVGAGLVTALKGPGGNLSTAAWAGGVLTIAGAAENLGDRSVAIEITPPGASSPIPNRSGGPIGTITDEGSVGAALTAEITDAGLPQLKASG
jgi:hypothetical protein